ncbi:MAG: PorP/SprF family type IX secretion system membrane protein [Haliscomenobacter sp.]|nr:PorP/SprF family type IX secretion system membrane protein [Haliscomenobacter sp.]
MIPAIYAAGQQINYLSSFKGLLNAWSPASSALEFDPLIAANARNRWLGFQGAPVAYFLNYTQPLTRMNSGFGLAVVFDERGPLSYTQGQASYSYKLEMDRRGENALGIGVSFGYNQYRINSMKFNTPSQNPDVLLNFNDGTFSGIQVGAGFAFQYKDADEYDGKEFIASVSYYRVLPQKQFLDQTLVFDERQSLFGYFSATITSPAVSFYFRPVATINVYDFHYFRYELHANVGLKDIGWIGMGFFPFEEMIFNIGLSNNLFQLPIGFNFIYNYNLRSIPKNQASSVELGMSMKLSRKKWRY